MRPVRRWRMMLVLSLAAVAVVCCGFAVADQTLAVLSIAAFPWSLVLTITRPYESAALLIFGTIFQWIFIGLLIDSRRFRWMPGHCLNCKYDLRGSPGPRCPECGTRIGKRQS